MLVKLLSLFKKPKAAVCGAEVKAAACMSEAKGASCMSNVKAAACTVVKAALCSGR